MKYPITLLDMNIAFSSGYVDTNELAKCVEDGAMTLKDSLNSMISSMLLSAVNIMFIGLDVSLRML